MTALDPKSVTAAIALGIRLVDQVLGGSIDVEGFLAAFGDLYDEWALDGHESDAAGLELLASMSSAVAVLAVVRNTIWTLFPDGEDEDAYRAAGRLPLRDFLPKLRALVTPSALAGAVTELHAVSQRG